MAQLPNGEHARIPMEKLTDYCLNPAHPRGKDKARVFAALLGITCDSANALAALVRQAAMEGDITQEAVTIFGGTPVWIGLSRRGVMPCCAPLETLPQAKRCHA